jgi:hypothetical protein
MAPTGQRGCANPVLWRRRHKSPKSGILACMRGKRVKSTGKKIFGYAKWLLGWPFAIFGITGVTDSFDTWSRWIDKALSWAHSAMTDPRVQQLAAKAVEFADFVNQAPVRITLVIIGVLILIWGWRPFWSLRHHFFFLWRRALGEEVWIDGSKARQLLEESDWGRLRRPISNFLDGIAGSLQGGVSPYAKNMLKFNHFIKLTMDSFEENNPNSVRLTSGKKEYKESVLRAFFSHALDDEVVKQFGDVPAIRAE